MLKLLNQDKKLIANINNYSELCIESELLTFDSTLSFKYPLDAVFKNDIEEEGYIRNKYNEYVIREVNTKNNELEVYCFLNFEDLEGKFFEHFNTVTTTIEDCLNLAFAGTGWSVATSNIFRKRTIKLTNVTSFKILKEAKKVFRAEYKVDTINKKISIFEKIGTDKGTYFIDSLNLKEIEVQSNTHDFITRLIVEGKDGLTIESINNNKKYIENFQYSKKIKTYFWKDERYTSKESLKEDGEYKLNELSKPAKSYNLEIIDLAKINKRYKDILDYGLGDTVTLLSKKNKLKEKQRIVKIIEYPHDPHKNSCELANTILTFEDLQQDLQDAADIIDNITTDNGTIDGSTVDEIEKEQIKNFDIEVGKVVNLDVVNAKIENLIVNKADITSLNAVNANIGNLQATKANITDLSATNATISNLQATKADIVDLNVTNAKINVLEVETAKIGVLQGDVANIQDIIGGNISSDNIQTGGITGDRLNMNTIFVNDANIVNVNANKINSGEINTNKVKIKSADGGIEIVGPTQQWKDKNNKVRMQAGKDAQGNFTFGIFDETGTGTLIDHTGIKEKALGSNIIKENMISSDAVGEKQINYNSFATGFNKDTNTSTLKATKVKLDNQNQTLDVAFTSLKSQADATKTTTESNTTQINVQQGQISTAIANTKIVKDGKEVLLKDDYNTTVATVNSMKNTISSHTTKIDNNTGKITGVESKTNVLERDLNSMSSKISATETTVKTHTTQITTAQNTANSATSKADKAQQDANTANNKVDDLEIGGRNILLNTDFRLNNPNNTGLGWDKNLNGAYTASYWSFYNGGVPNATQGYHAHLFNLEGELVVRYMENDRWQSATYSMQDISKKQLEKGVKYTYSFEIKSTKIGGFMYGGLYYRKIGGTTQGFHMGQYHFDINQIGKWQRYTYTFIIPEDMDLEQGISIYNYGDKVKGTNYVRRFKLEKGEKATDHTIAPEDIQVEINKNKNDIITVNTEVTTTKNKVSGIEQNINSITQRVGSVESTTTTHTATINNHTSSLNAVDGKINTAKNQAINDAKAYTNTEVTKVNSTMTSKFAEIKTTTDSITQSVSNTNKEVSTVKVNVTNAQNSANNANSKIDNLQIGNRNYLPQSNKLLKGSGAAGLSSIIDTDGSLKITSTSGNGNWFTSFVASYGNIQSEFKEGEDITVSLIIKSNQKNCPTFYFKSGMGYYPFPNAILTNEYKQFSLTTKWKVANGLSFHLGFSSVVGVTNILKIKIEKGNKATDWTPAPEDVSKEILDITTEKVNQAKAEIKVTTDSITNRVSSTEQTTTTLTTNVNKAQSDATKGINDAKNAQSTANTANSQASTNKNEITKTNSKVASVETNLNGITSRVSSVESTTSTLNGKVNSHESRIATAEQKITPNAIINTVSSTIDNKVGVVNNRVTEVTQNLEGFKVDVSNTTMSNLLVNSEARGLANWEKWTYGHPLGLIVETLTSSHDWAYKDDLAGTFQLRIQDGWAQASGESAIMQRVPTEVGQKYSFSFLVAAHRCEECYFYLRNHDGSLIMAEGFVPRSGGANSNEWTLIERSITAIGGSVLLEIGFKRTTNDPYMWITKPMINKGSKNAPYANGSRGLYQGITKIDGNGVRCDFEDGSYASMGRNGLRYYKNGMSNPYQYITFNSRIAAIRNGHWRNVRLPDAFRGKQINLDFQLFVTLGNYNLNAYVSGSINGALRVAFAEWSGWDANNCTINIRPCFQKIGLDTKKLYGWDAGSTSSGAIANEGEGDVIIFAQM